MSILDMSVNGQSMVHALLPSLSKQLPSLLEFSFRKLFLGSSTQEINLAKYLVKSS